jgi:hypothetical protein
VDVVDLDIWNAGTEAGVVEGVVGPLRLEDQVLLLQWRGGGGEGEGKAGKRETSREKLDQV